MRWTVPNVEAYPDNAVGEAETLVSRVAALGVTEANVAAWEEDIEDPCMSDLVAVVVGEEERVGPSGSGTVGSADLGVGMGPDVAHG